MIIKFINFISNIVGNICFPTKNDNKIINFISNLVGKHIFPTIFDIKIYKLRL